SPSGTSAEVRLVLAEDLPQVIFHVADVVAHEVFERRRFALAYLYPADLFEVVSLARREARCFGRALHDVREVKVETAPERDQEGPRLFDVGLRAHPTLLLVAGEDKFVRELRADEALV